MKTKHLISLTTLAAALYGCGANVPEPATAAAKAVAETEMLPQEKKTEDNRPIKEVAENVYKILYLKHLDSVLNAKILPNYVPPNFLPVGSLVEFMQNDYRIHMYKFMLSEELDRKNERGLVYVLGYPEKSKPLLAFTDVFPLGTLDEMQCISNDQKNRINAYCQAIPEVLKGEETGKTLSLTAQRIYGNLVRLSEKNLKNEFDSKLDKETRDSYDQMLEFLDDYKKK